MRFLIMLGGIVLFLHFFLNGGDLLPALGGNQQHIHFHEGFPKCFLVILLLVVGILFELFDKMPLHKSSNFSS